MLTFLFYHVIGKTFSCLILHTYICSMHRLNAYFFALSTTFSNQLVFVGEWFAHPNTGFFQFPRVLPSPIAAASYFLMASCPQPPPRTAHSFAMHSCHDHISRLIVNWSTVSFTTNIYSVASPPKVTRSYFFVLNIYYKCVKYVYY